MIFSYKGISLAQVLILAFSLAQVLILAMVIMGLSSKLASTSTRGGSADDGDCAFPRRRTSRFAREHCG